MKVSVQESPLKRDSGTRLSSDLFISNLDILLAHFTLRFCMLLSKDRADANLKLCSFGKLLGNKTSCEVSLLEYDLGCEHVGVAKLVI